MTIIYVEKQLRQKLYYTSCRGRALKMARIDTKTADVIVTV